MLNDSWLLTLYSHFKKMADKTNIVKSLKKVCDYIPRRLYSHPV